MPKAAVKESRLLRFTKNYLEAPLCNSVQCQHFNNSVSGCMGYLVEKLFGFCLNVVKERSSFGILEQNSEKSGETCLLFTPTYSHGHRSHGIELYNNISCKYFPKFKFPAILLLLEVLPSLYEYSSAVSMSLVKNLRRPKESQP